ncbi:phage virion morphogenesis protein [Acinetobacter sp. ANC 3832]|uniref:phage virion morphogenesis protein n=1 Tax=Acinetobacter sp. ANC 3832 TaxID=1977874 RepID=UPI000A34513A|nr:phage virion morphogenesis protein [Acinetobacter sp. ANC 3832]OTG87214.1 virion morphogenesis protein [Acinetobacter sp. ANC 3832]
MTKGNVQFHGQEKITEWLNRALRELDDPTPLLNEIGSILEFNTKERINTGIGTDDKPWQKSWRARVRGGTTLRDTSRLYNSIKYQVVNGKRVVIGTNVMYAALMHFGGMIKPKNGKFLTFKTPTGGWVRVKSVTIKPRPYLGVSVDDSQDILFTIEEYLEKVLKDAKPVL